MNSNYIIFFVSAYFFISIVLTIFIAKNYYDIKIKDLPRVILAIIISLLFSPIFFLFDKDRWKTLKRSFFGLFFKNLIQTPLQLKHSFHLHIQVVIPS